MASYLGVGIFLFPLFFYKVRSLHPPLFRRNDFSTCKHLGSSIVESSFDDSWKGAVDGKVSDC